MKADNHDVILAGSGGQGVLTAGQFIAEVCMDKYQYVAFLPSYEMFMRGGPSECAVVLSQKDSECPIVTKAEAVVIMDSSRAEIYESRIKPGGWFIVESSRGEGIKPKSGDHDLPDDHNIHHPDHHDLEGGKGDESRRCEDFVGQRIQ